ncbi:hypothetical protein GCM10027079_12790 [Sediminivirga luteola]|uniref:MaoC-like domain-containing protein n=1 Tax=Sediminivirga luteola TaxID=1774748 RepID=A0A8J2TV19_9MICO|nr:hypothetical protein GCM10011333_00240 [Sediminivirga luteola]
MAEIVQRGLWFEEFTAGDVYRHAPGRTITEADNTWFSAVTMNPQAIHVDAAFAAEQPFGQRLVNSMFTLATLVGLSVSQLSQGTIVANLGFSEVSFPAPLFHGDTLYAVTEIKETRLSKSRPGQGIVTLEHRGYNQDGVLVARAVRQTLMHCRPQDADAADGPGGAQGDAGGPSGAPGAEVAAGAQASLGPAGAGGGSGIADAGGAAGTTTEGTR